MKDPVRNVRKKPMTYKVTDLVDDLRWIGATDAETYEHVLEDVVHPTVKEAADELERLRGRADKLQAQLDAALKLIEKWRNDGSLNKGFCADDLAYALRDKDANPDS
jgi:hypothetical protein